MDRPLAGRVVLVVDDEPLIALDVSQALENAGACVVIANLISDALKKAERPDLTAAVLDHGLDGADTSEVCAKLANRNIPFVIYTGLTKVSGACSLGVLVSKPAPTNLVVATLVGLLQT